MRITHLGCIALHPLVLGLFCLFHTIACMASDVLIFDLNIQFFIQYAVFKVRIGSSFSKLPSGDGEIRTLDPLLARQVLSQLSYTPTDSSWDAGPPVSRATSILLIGFFNPMGLSGPFLPCECYRGKGTPKWA